MARGRKVGIAAVVTAIAICWAVMSLGAYAQGDELTALNKDVRTLYRDGKYAEGLVAAQKYVEVAKSRVGENSPRYAVALDWLALLNKALGRYADAEPLYKHALTIIEATRGPEHPEVAVYLAHLGKLYMELARFQDAEQLHKRALEITEKVRGAEHIDVVDRLNDLADVYEEQTRTAEAMELSKRALAVTEKVRGPNHPDVAEQLAYMARASRSRRPDEAEALYKRSLAIRQAAFGTEDLSVVVSLVSLAELYKRQARFVDAEPLYKQALAITEKARGSEHVDVASRLTSLALMYSAQHRHAEAALLYSRALEITEKALGPEHPSVGPRLFNLAHVYRAQGRYAEAERLLKRAVALGEKTLGPQSLALSARLGALAAVYEAQGRTAEAEPLYRRVLSMSEKVYGPDHPGTAVDRLVLGGFYKSVGRLGEAQPLLEVAVATLEKFGPLDAYLLTLLADLYRLQGQCERAEPLFVRAMAISKEDLKEVAVLFGTDRKVDSSQSSVAFGNERARELSLGLAVVALPRPEIEKSPAQLNIAPKEMAGDASPAQRRLTLRCIQIVKDKALIETAARRLTVSKAFPNQAFVFVHGYNVSFDNAVRRAAQIAYDLKFDGGAFLFSWPSRGKIDIRAYLSDRETVDLAGAHLREFLETVVVKTKPEKIHFVAHSMGNLVLLQALDKILSERPDLRNMIGEIVQAAPDVDADVFARAVESLKARGATLTLYASSSDKALWLSGWLRNGVRAGFISKSKPLIIGGVDTIDITDAGTGLFGLNHDLYLASPIIVGDMRRIFESGARPPDKRTKELDAVSSQDGTYWRLRTQ